MKSYQAAALSLIVIVSIVVLGGIAVFSFTVFFGTREALISRESQDIQPSFADRDVTALDAHDDVAGIERSR